MPHEYRFGAVFVQNHVKKAAVVVGAGGFFSVFPEQILRLGASRVQRRLCVRKFPERYMHKNKRFYRLALFLRNRVNGLYHSIWSLCMES